MSEPPITGFPSELLVNIFNKLPDLEKPICSLVCARWRSVVKGFWPNLHDSPYELLYYGVKNGDKKQVSLAKQLGGTILRKGMIYGIESEKNCLNHEEIRRLLAGLCESVNIAENGPLYGENTDITAIVIIVYQSYYKLTKQTDKDIERVISHYVLEPRKKSSKFIIPVVRIKVYCACCNFCTIIGWEWTGDKPFQFTVQSLTSTVKKVIKLSPGEKKVDPLHNSLFLNFPCAHITLSENPNESFYFYIATLPSGWAL